MARHEDGRATYRLSENNMGEIAFFIVLDNGTTFMVRGEDATFFTRDTVSWMHDQQKQSVDEEREG